MKVTKPMKEIIADMSKAKIEIKKGVIYSDGDLNQLEKSLASYLVRKNDEYKFFWSIPNKYGGEGVFITNVLKVWDELSESMKVKDTFVHQLNINDYHKEQETYLTAVANVNEHNKYQFQYRQKFDDVWKSYMGSLENINTRDIPKSWLSLINEHIFYKWENE